MENYGIYNVDLGEGEGHEQSYRRPAILFKNLSELDLSIVIPLTSNINHLNFPYSVQINKTKATNLKENSVALIFQIRTISEKRIIGNQIGKIEEYQINKIKTIIKDMLNL